MPYIGQARTRPYADAARIAADPEYGRIVCHCERVTRGEIRDALASPLPPADLDGLRRRTRVLNGRCQGFYCAATVSALLANRPARGGTGVRADVVVIGAGPAGLAAAVELRRLGAGRVLVVDRDDAAGGIPRHSAHTGFGGRDLRRVLTGPAYARRYADAAAAAGADIRLGTTVTGWDGPHRVTLTSPAGTERADAAAVLLATGCRERPRPARLIPGDRPPGVMTTGELQRRVYLGGQRLAGRALVVGAEHVSFSAMVTLAHAGAEVIALVTGQPRHTSYAAFALAAAWRWRVPVWPSTTVARVQGRDRLEGVELAGPDGTPGSSRATCWCSPGTGSPTTNWPERRAWTWTPAPGARWSTRPWGPRCPACSRRATWCTRRRRPTSPRSVAGTRRGGSWRSCGAGRPAAPEPVRLPVTVEPPLLWIAPNVLRARGPGSAARDVSSCAATPSAAGPDRSLAGRAAAGHVAAYRHATGPAGTARCLLDGQGRPGRRPGDRAAGLTRAGARRGARRGDAPRALARAGHARPRNAGRRRP